MDGYFLEGIDNELLLVIRGGTDEQMLSIIHRMQKMRDKEIKELGQKLENHFNDRGSD